MKNKFLTFLSFIFVFYSTTTCAATFKGKVIDADTKEPIEGAVVVASWTEEAPTAAGSTSRLKDVKETLTNTKGEWVIKGPKGEGISSVLSFFTSGYSTRPPVFIVFKPGYCSYPAGFGIDSCKGKIKEYNPNNSETIGEIVELPRLTNREDRKRSLPSPFHKDGNGSFYSKQGAFIKLINEESRNIGLSEYDNLKGYEK